MLAAVWTRPSLGAASHFRRSTGTEMEDYIQTRLDANCRQQDLLLLTVLGVLDPVASWLWEVS